MKSADFIHFYIFQIINTLKGWTLLHFILFSFVSTHMCEEIIVFIHNFLLLQTLYLFEDPFHCARRYWMSKMNKVRSQSM